MAKKIKKGAGFILNKALISILLSISLIVGGIFIYQKAFAVNNITPATGGENISLDTVGGSYTTLGTISITEAALAEIKTGTHTFTLPPGWEFNTASTITFFSNWETSGLLVDGSFDITPSANFFSINVVWESWQAPATISFSNIKVRPTHTTPQSALKITHTAGVMTGVTNGNGNGVVGDNFGLLSSIVGQAASLRVTSSGASSVSTTVGVSKPLTITAYDKHGNIVSSGPNNYIGAKNLIFSGLSSSPAGGVPNVNGVNLGGATSITFTNGVASATVTPYKAESVSLDVLQSGTSVSSASDASYDLDISTVDNTKPVITLTGANPQTIEVGSAYSELGATASDNHDGNITASIVINATAVNTAVVGSYTITYNVTDSNSNVANQVNRTVNVVDTTIPVITLVGANPQTIEVGSAYTELNATALDNYDGNITASIVINATAVNTAVVGSYSVTYNVTDTHGNVAAQKTRTVNIVDTTIPVITLTGANPQTIEVGSSYTELGATASDNYDGNITGSIVINATAVNTAVVGSYTVTYNVTDAHSNAAAQKTRTVNVVDTTIPVITLTGINPQVIEVGSAYTELGATASDNYDGNISGNIVISTTTINTSVVGSYSATYDVTDAHSNTAVQKIRTVNVVDTTIPVITLTGANPQTIEAGSAYTELGATALDNYDGDISGSIIISTTTVNTAVVGSYSATYNVIDDHGNAATQVTRTVNVVDTTAPVITLVGANPQTIAAGNAYTELGATANDIHDGNITGSIAINAAAVNTSVVGSYTVTYDVTDAHSNAATQIDRTVNVVPGVIHHYSVSAIGNQTAGASFDLAIQAQDQFNHNIITGADAVEAINISLGKIDAGAANNATSTSGGSATINITLTTATTTQSVIFTGAASSKTGTSAAFNVSPAGIHHFDVSGIAGGVAGITSTATVAARDIYNNVKTDYTGTVVATSTDAQIVTAGSLIFGGITGQITVDVSLKTAGTQTVTFSQSGADGINGSQSEIVITPAAAATVSINTQPANTNGNVDNILQQQPTVIVRDQYNNSVADGTAVSATLVSGDGVLRGNATTTLNGTAAFTGLGYSKSGEAFTVKFTASGIDSAVSDSITALNPGTITAISKPIGADSIIAGVETAAYTATSTDQYGNLVADTYFWNAIAGTGIATLNVDKLTGQTAGTVTLVVTSNTTFGNNNKSITVGPGAIHHFNISGIANSSAGATSTATVIARDAYNNKKIDYAGTVVATSTDALITTNGSLVFNGTSGEINVDVSLKTIGTHVVTFSQSDNEAVNGSQTGIVITAGAIHHYIASSPGNQTAGAPFDAIIQAQDAFNNNITSGADSSEAINIAFGQADAGGSSNATSTSGGSATISVTATIAATGQTVIFTGATSGKYGTSGAFDVAGGSAHHFDVSGILNGAAGATSAATITARDQYNNIKTNYAGTVVATSTDAQLVTAGSLIFGGITGQITVDVTLKTAGTQVVTFSQSDDAGINGSQSNISVNPAALSAVEINTQPGNTNGNVDNVLQQQPIVNLKDAYNNLVTGNITVSASIVSGSGTLRGNSTTTADGIAAFTDLGYSKSGEAFTMKFTANAIDSAVSGSVTALNFGAVIDLTIIGGPANIAAGVESAAYTASSTDQYGNSVTSDIHNWSVANGTGTVTLNVDKLTGLTTGTVTLTATSTANALANDSLVVTVGAGAVHHFDVSGILDGIAGATSTATVIARDQYNNIKTDYAGTIVATSTDAQITTGSGLTFGGVTGQLSVDANLKTAGSQIVTFSDNGDAGINGSQSDIYVSPAGVDHYGVSAFGNQAAGVPFSITLQAQDVYNNNSTTTSENINITFGSPDAGAAPIATSTIDGAAAVDMTMTAATVGQSIIFTGAASGKVGTSNAFNVANNTAIDHIAFTVQPENNATSSAVFNPQPQITLYDAYNNVIATDSTTNVTITAVDAAATTTPAAGALGGTATVTVANGVASFTNLTYNKIDQIKLKAAAGGKEDFSNTIQNTPGALDHFTFAFDGEIIVAGVATTTVVTAYDADGNITYRDTDGSVLGSESITVTTNADAAPNPAYAPLYDGTDMRGAGTVKTVSFSGGTFTTGNIILYNATAAAKNIIITHSGVSGLDTLTVDPASIANLAISGDTPVTTAQISNINITGADAYSNVVTNNNSTNINLTSGGGSNLGSGGGALTAGLFTTTLTKDTAGAATVTVSSDGLTSKSVAITFTDGTGPTVDSWTPTDGVINVSRSINVVITFSEDMATTTLNSTNIKLKKYVAGDGSGEDTFMDVTPSGLRQAVLATSTPLAYGTKYYIYISTGVQDANGNSLQAAWDDTQASKDSHEFTTEAAETTAPTVVSWAPSDDSAGMSISPQIWIKFSEALDTSTVASGNIELRKYSDSSEVAVTYSIQDGDTKVVFNPTANLAYGTQYYFFIGTGLKDVVGNSFAANTWYAAQKAQHEFTTLTDLIIDDYVLEQSNATSTDLYADGWRYRFDISAYNANEEDMFVKFSDWARSGGGGSIAANGNMRMLIDESTGSEIAPMGGFTEDIIVNGSGSIKSYALGNNYADQTLLGVPNTPANITGLDRNGSLSGRQITFYIFTKIPAATPDGLYNTTYGILTQE